MNIEIQTHEPVDLDGLASAILCKKIFEICGHKVFINFEKPSSEVEKLSKIYSISFNSCPKPDLYLVLDTNALDFEKLSLKAPVLLIDHHQPKKLPKGVDSFIKSESTSTVEVLLDFFGKDVVFEFLDEKLARICAAAIVFDSAFFYAAKNSTFENLLFFLRKTSFEEVLKLLEKKYTEPEIKAIIAAFSRISYKKIEDYVVAWTYVGSFESSVLEKMRDLFDISLVFNKKAKRVQGRVANRLIRQGFNLAKIFAKFGGGGHPGAAGVKTSDFDKILEAVLNRSNFSKIRKDF
ncbi:MAG: DHH family phosphoesterase [archaeon]